MAKTSASFTIMDYTDGVSLITGIDSNLPLVQLYDQEKKTLNTSWATTALQLTPQVRIAGGSSVVSSLTNAKWARRFAGASSFTDITSGQNNETMSSTTFALTVNADKLTGNNWQMDYRFTASYYDATLKVTLPVEITVTLSRVSNGTSFVIARGYAPGGDQFKNGSPATLSLKAELIRGTETDTTSLTYQWAKSTNGTSWTNLTGSSTGVSSGATAATLVITEAAVDSFAMFRCTIKDTDSSSITYNQSFVTEGIAVLDVSDPYQAVIESTGGSYFKKGTDQATTSTVLICRVYQNGTEIDPTGANLTYTWTMTDKDGAAVSGFTPTAVAHGSIVTTKKKAITVSSDSVTVKGTFFCSVS